MTTMLRQVLTAFEQAHAPLSLTELARQLDVTPAMIEGMIRYWVSKGRLRERIDGTCDMETGSCSCGSGKGGCPYIVLMPRSYELVPEQGRPQD
ncbi:MAG: hypothetical protein JW910_06580 [Anaerolineae bacterium]|nr:hypothetical protein [Anaerolineae bacterium]